MIAWIRILLLLGGFKGTPGFFFQKPVSASPPLLKDLQGLIDESQNGLDQSRLDEIKSLMVTISADRKGDQRESLPGKWELIFTTEQEVNFFKTSWPFAKVSIITQDIDPFNTCTVGNSIMFEGGAEFAVSGQAGPAESDSEYDRVKFEFESAVARVWGRDISLPPVGTGYFDTMFCNDEYRLSQDSRGDWSVFKRL